jgi:hypothetical protein
MHAHCQQQPSPSSSLPRHVGGPHSPGRECCLLIDRYWASILADRIRHSDGGVSEHKLASWLKASRSYQAFRWWEPGRAECRADAGSYQAFRWWGIGTNSVAPPEMKLIVSGIPMVGYRNGNLLVPSARLDRIRHSNGGVLERTRAAWSSVLDLIGIGAGQRQLLHQRAAQCPVSRGARVARGAVRSAVALSARLAVLPS